VPLTSAAEAFSMADDGTGRLVTIPSIFVSNSYGLRMIKYIILSEEITRQAEREKTTSTTPTSVSISRHKLFVDVSMRQPPVAVVDSSVSSSVLPLQFSLQSLREVGILPEAILGQISRGLSQEGEEDDVAAEVKTSVLREEEAMKRRYEEDDDDDDEEDDEEDDNDEEEEGEEGEEGEGEETENSDGEENGDDSLP